MRREKRRWIPEIDSVQLRITEFANEEKSQPITLKCEDSHEKCAKRSKNAHNQELWSKMKKIFNP